MIGAHIGLVARRIQGSVGPGGCDSSHWQDVLLRFGTSSQHLRDAVAGLTRRLANSLIDWHLIQALLANRLIALDKSPGVRPIGIGETLWRIIGKSVCLLTREDAELVCGASQLCAGLKCGVEGAIHAAVDLFDSNDHGVLVIDASNAFNSINRLSLLWNVRVLWPRASRFIFNTYRGWSSLIIKGCNRTLYSQEGVIQGDPLSMFIYAIATVPLIREVENKPCWTQLWYADDSSAIGEITNLHSWLVKLLEIGPRYGYFPEPNKSSLIVKESMLSYARSCFHDLGVNVVTNCRFLGGVIGDTPGKHSFVSRKVGEWSHYIAVL